MKKRIAAIMLTVMIALTAGMPAVFAAGIDPGSGPGLIFESLPYTFQQMSLAIPVISGAMR